MPITLARRPGVFAELDPNVIAQLASLAGDTRFKLLRKVYEQRRDEMATYLGRQQLQFGPPLNQREADRRAGFWQGVNAILSSPESADRALDEVLNDQGRIDRLVDN